MGGHPLREGAARERWARCEVVIAGGITGVHEWVFSQTPAGVHVTTDESFAGEPVKADVTGMQSALDSSLIARLAHLKAAAESKG